MHKGALVVIYNPDTKLYCVGQRSFDDDNYSGYFDFFGGGIEINETPIDAAKRELFEESGLIVNTLDLNKLNTLTNGNYTIYYYSYNTNLNLPITLNNEHVLYRWVSKNWLISNIESLHPATRLFVDQFINISSVVKANQIDINFDNIIFCKEITHEGKLTSYYMYLDCAMVGTAAVGNANKRLYNVYIDADYRQYGLSYRLLSKVIDLEKPTNLVVKSTGKMSNLVLSKLYENFGFKRKNHSLYDFYMEK